MEDPRASMSMQMEDLGVMNAQSTGSPGMHLQVKAPVEYGTVTQVEGAGIGP